MAVVKGERCYCPLGHGDCPVECPNYDNSLQWTINSGAGDEFDGFISRMSVVFGDALSHEVRVDDVAAAISGCIKEEAPELPTESSE